MNCMKCGSVIPAGQVFCDECLADMEKHPVKPGTPLILPRREKQTVTKRSRKRVHKPEEIISKLRRTVVCLMALIAAMGIALTIAVYLLVNQNQTEGTDLLPGQNYGTSEPA